MRSQRGFVLACALTGTLALAGSAAADTRHPGQPERSSGPRRARGQARAHRGAAHRRARPRRRRSRGTSSARRRRSCGPAARWARPSRARARRDAARAWLSSNRSLFRLSSTQGWRWSATTRWPAAPPRRHAAPDDRRPRRVGRRHGHHRRGQGRQRLEGRLGRRRTLNGDRTLDGKARLRDGQAWQAAAAQRRPRQVAGADRAPARQEGPRPRLEGPARRRAGQRAAGPRRWPSRPSSQRLRAGVRDARARHPGGRADRLPRVRRRAQRRGPRAREPGRQRERRSAGRPRRRRRTTLSTARCRRRTRGCDTPEGPVHRRRRPTACARSTSSPTPTRTVNDIVLKLFSGTHRGRRGRTRSARPSASATRPTAACPAGDYFVAAVRLRRRQRAGRAAHLHGHDRASTRARRPAPYTARWRANPANPPLNPLPAGPVEQPEHRHAREHVLEAEHDAVGLRQGRRQPRVALAVGLQPARQRLDDHDARATTRARPSPGRTAASPGPNQFHPVSADARLHVPVDQRVVHQDCDPGTPYGANFQVGKSFDVAAAVTNLFAVHNRMHDFAYLLGFTEDNFNSPASRTSASPRPFRENDPVRRRRAGRRGDRRRPASTPARATTRTCRRCPTARRRSRTCTCGSRSRAPSTRRASTATTTPASSATSTRT